MTKKLIRVARGIEKADIVLKNCNIVDVFSKQIICGDVAICGEYIVGIGEYNGLNEINLDGKFVMPGFIDSHVHIESSMVTPIEYAKVVMPNGITTVFADPHEIANVCGEDGIDYMIECGKNTPLSVNFMVPSCVPATPFENSGAVLDSNKVKKLLGKCYGLGEMMNYPGVLCCDDEVIKKLKCTDIIDGHAPNVSGKDLNAYICAGIKTDHECVNISEMKEKISKGMYVLIREGTLGRDLENLVGGIDNANVRRCLFCSDDRYIGDIIDFGTINYCIKKSISKGINAIDAITIASFNAAECYGLKKLGAIAPGYIADIVVADNLQDFNILHVYKNGVLVAKDGKHLFENKSNINCEKVINTVHIPKITQDSLKINNHKKEFEVIHINPHTITTTKVIRTMNDKLSKVAVIERHHNKDNISIGFVENYDIIGGAIASSIGHDSHNIIVIGDNDADMAGAVNALGTTGGIAMFSNGKLASKLDLPIAGLISDKPYSEVLNEHKMFHKCVNTLGINPEIDPFMTLAFLSLPVIPEIRITDMGLFDVTKFEFIK